MGRGSTRFGMTGCARVAVITGGADRPLVALSVVDEETGTPVDPAENPAHEALSDAPRGTSDPGPHRRMDERHRRRRPVPAARADGRGRRPHTAPSDQRVRRAIDA